MSQFTRDIRRNEWIALRYFHEKDGQGAMLERFTTESGLNRSLAAGVILGLADKDLIMRKKARAKGIPLLVAMKDKGKHKPKGDPLTGVAKVLAETVSDAQLRLLSQFMGAVIDNYDPDPDCAGDAEMDASYKAVASDTGTRDSNLAPEAE